jgi:hypothetical protein
LYLFLHIMSRESYHKYLYPVNIYDVSSRFFYIEILLYIVFYKSYSIFLFFSSAYVVKHLSLSYRHFSFATIICLLGKSDLLFSHTLPLRFISNACFMLRWYSSKKYTRPTQTNNYIENYTRKKQRSMMMMGDNA